MQVGCMKMGSGYNTKEKGAQQVIHRFPLCCRPKEGKPQPKHAVARAAVAAGAVVAILAVVGVAVDAVAATCPPHCDPPAHQPTNPP